MQTRFFLFVGAAVLFAGILLAVFWLFALSGESGDSESAVASSGSKAEEKYYVVEYTIEEGDTWGKIAERLELGHDAAAFLFGASLDVHNLASIHAGNGLRFLFDVKSDELEGMEYDIDEEEFLKIEKDEAGEFLARKENISYEIDTVVRRGIIESSLFETAQEKGIPPGIILELAWIFSWDIDFASNVKRGDSFVVAYEDRFREGEYAGPGRILAARFTSKSKLWENASDSGKSFFAFFYEMPGGKGGYYDETGRELRRQFLRSPLDYKRVTSGFSQNRYHPILQTFTTHRAVDYSADSGTPISATADGRVTYVGRKGWAGNFVELKHGNGYRTGYAHLSAFAKGVKYGAKVNQNQLIGFVGSTGLSTGSHLHYEMRKNGALINPLRLDLPPGDMINEKRLDSFLAEKEKLMRLIL